MHSLETYLQDLAEIRASDVNVKELSYYPTLKDLLDTAGKELKPKVCRILSLKNQGALVIWVEGGIFVFGCVLYIPKPNILFTGWVPSISVQAAT